MIQPLQIIRLVEMVEETYNLIELHLPEVDVERLRQVFRYKRPSLDGPPRIKKSIPDAPLRFKLAERGSYVHAQYFPR